jgi:hypothetical protein
MLDNLKCVRPISLLAAAAVLAVSPIAHAEPVHMKCSGQMMLSNNKVLDMNAVLSLTVDLSAKTVTVGSYPPLGIMSPGISNTENEVSFFGSTSYGVLNGNVDRVTGEAYVHFFHNTPQEKFFIGNCGPAQKLF